MLRNQQVRSAVVTSAAMMVAFLLAWLLETLAGLNPDVVVLAVVLTLSLGRALRPGRGPVQGVVPLVLAVVAVGAGGVGRLLQEHPNAGGTVFTLALGLSVWVRRFGPQAARLGTLIALPFIGLLVAPMPLPPGAAQPLWGAVAAVIAYASVVLARSVADRTGFTAPAPSDEPVRPAPQPRGRVAVSTRMALQMTVAVGASFALGRWAYPDHWPWLVLTAFIVCSGNRGRGDVLHKAGLRVVGAGLGTLAATPLAGLFGPGDRRSIVVILAVLAVATCLRAVNYAYWAGAVTAALSLLYGYFGQTGQALLVQRLAAIVLGAALAVAASWLLLPVRSRQVLRGRAAALLTALGELADAVRHRPEGVGHHRARCQEALRRVEEVARPPQLHRLLTRRLSARRRPAAHAADALEAARRCASAVARLGDTADSTVPAAALAELDAARAELGRVLRATRPAAAT
ncbi:FUSC family protein [Kitasatospora sp. NPDC051170]|uniref:FUSC family protein n=1 Tax=Kitasatospora sp. NPDC051170 TaxID=3364056 RepID=UPI00379ADC0E